jgi:uncharacterized protein (DUF58 family)
MRPTRILLGWLLSWSGLGLAASFQESLRPFWVIVGLLLAGLFVLDAFRLITAGPLRVERVLPSRFALGVAQEVSLVIHNPGRVTARVELFDGIPATAVTTAFPWWGTIPGGGQSSLNYSVRLLRRGRAEFAPTHVLRVSPFGCWGLALRSGLEEAVPVFPDYEPVLHYALLALANREQQMGIQQRQRKGVSREFHQLRDYQEGDLLSQVDWKATSRRRSLVSREFREQRDQNIIFMIDAGRRMRAMDGDLPQFDHCLNAVLLLCYIALRQGGNVGVSAFGGVEKWLPPVKGPRAMTTLLHHLHDYETTPNPSDFSEAAGLILVRQRKRSLLVLLTNLRGEDAADVLLAVQTLRQRHVVILATLRERSVEQLRGKPVETFDDSVLFGASQLYMEERSALLERVRAAGAMVVDTVASDLPVALANAYLEVKRSGRL